MADLSDAISKEALRTLKNLALRFDPQLEKFHARIDTVAYIKLESKVLKEEKGKPYSTHIATLTFLDKTEARIFGESEKISVVINGESFAWLKFDKLAVRSASEGQPVDKKAANGHACKFFAARDIHIYRLVCYLLACTFVGSNFFDVVDPELTHARRKGQIRFWATNDHALINSYSCRAIHEALGLDPCTENLLSTLLDFEATWAVLVTGRMLEKCKDKRGEPLFVPPVSAHALTGKKRVAREIDASVASAALGRKAPPPTLWNYKICDYEDRETIRIYCDEDAAEKELYNHIREDYRLQKYETLEEKKKHCRRAVTELEYCKEDGGYYH